MISQLYGGGGNAGSTFRNDFIELFNRGASPVNVNGWSVQYAAAAGSSWQVTNLTNVTIQPGQYYLVQEAIGAGGTTNLPTPDATGAIPMSATAGKVALVNNTTALTCGATNNCLPNGNIIDFVGFGATPLLLRVLDRRRRQATPRPFCAALTAAPRPIKTQPILRPALQTRATLPQR